MWWSPFIFLGFNEQLYTSQNVLKNVHKTRNTGGSFFLIVLGIKCSIASFQLPEEIQSYKSSNDALYSVV